MKTDEFFDRQTESDLLPLPLHFRMLRRFEDKRETVAARFVPPGESLLDLGCGTGNFVRLVAGRFGRIVATDVSSSAIEEARRSSAHKPGDAEITWKVLDGNGPMPFTDGEFSAVVTLSTLQYIFDPEAFLAEVRRVLRPGGRFLVEVPNMAYFPQRLRLLVGRPIKTSFWPKGIDGGNLHYFTVDLLADLVRKAGFAVVEVACSGIGSRFRKGWVGALGSNIILACDAV
jgi:SAM-dependent methyltransferase